MEVSVHQPPAAALRDRRGDALGELRVLPDETLCYILELLTPRDIARLACVSSVMYILCNEEPLWMTLCLKRVRGFLQYKGSWKQTALVKDNLPEKYTELPRKQVRCDGFNSLFLYRRLYRCHTTLGEFSVDNGNVERRNNLSLEVFRNEYDGKKPVMLTGMVNAWPARSKWTMEHFLENYGDTAFKISQKSANKISMNFKDYASYIGVQHDEDPLYIFDEKFGEVAPSLLEDYSVPDIFREDFFDLLDKDQRPSYRWLIIGPQRSGASWHVDPCLTSAWNTLLCGRKRWALYPPGKVPFGVTVHVNEEDGDVNIETPSSLQWWLDFYPLLADEDKPIECTQLPGETIYVPSGWWHCVLNIETTIAVTQNFVNSNNFEFVCLDMAPGYRHKGVCRAGFLALDEDSFEDMKQKIFCDTKNLSHSDAFRKEKKARTCENEDKSDNGRTMNGAPKSYNLWKVGFSYDIDLLAKFLDKERDHYTSPWSSGNMGPKELRQWLHRLWMGKPGMRDLIWKGACMAVNVDKWSERVAEICAFHNLPHPTEDERFPVGTGSNPVYLVGDSVIKFFVEDGLECSLYGLGTELEFYSLLHDVNSTLKNHIPEIMGCGILYQENGSFNIVPWDGKGIPDVIANCNLIPAKCNDKGFAFGLWGKTIYRYKEAGTAVNRSTGPDSGSNIWPYLITRKCEGKLFAELKDKLSLEDMTNLASFLGQQLQTLHLLPHPLLNISCFKDSIPDLDVADVNGGFSTLYKSKDQVEWEIFVRTLNRKRDNLLSRLKNWGNPIPGRLMEKLDEYIPDDFAKLINWEKDASSPENEYRPCSLIHCDIMDDNILIEALKVESSSIRNKYTCERINSFMNACDVGTPKSWHPSYIIDFSDLSIGHPILDIIPIYLDIFKGDSRLLGRLLESYKLPLKKRVSNCESMDIDEKCGRLSYHAMCYCILHDENILGAIFSIWDHLTAADSWEEVELTVWGDLNSYQGFT